MRYLDDEGRVWTVRDVAQVPERTLVEPGHPQSVERYFIAGNGEKRLYSFTEGEHRSPSNEQLERQLRDAKLFAPQRVSAPILKQGLLTP